MSISTSPESRLSLPIDFGYLNTFQFGLLSKRKFNEKYVEGVLIEGTNPENNCLEISFIGAEIITNIRKIKLNGRWAFEFSCQEGNSKKSFTFSPDNARIELVHMSSLPINKTPRPFDPFSDKEELIHN